MDLTLHQFAFSHFNEKARWALAYKGLAHHREIYLPGPHMPAIRKLSGQTQTPVLQTNSGYIAGSAAIIDHLETSYPDPPLYPAESPQRQQALQLQQTLDLELGPAVRTALFSALINELSYLCHMFAGHTTTPKRLAYRMTLPLVKGMIAKGNGTDDADNIARCFERTMAWLDQLQQSLTPSGYLVGDQFSVADLSAAALLAPIASVTHIDMKRPDPIPDSVQHVFDQFSEHPTIGWVNQIYQQHRP